jgi:hypothetical protein
MELGKMNKEMKRQREREKELTSCHVSGKYMAPQLQGSCHRNGVNKGVKTVSGKKRFRG